MENHKRETYFEETPARQPPVTSGPNFAKDLLQGLDFFDEQATNPMGAEDVIDEYEAGNSAILDSSDMFDELDSLAESPAYEEEEEEEATAHAIDISDHEIDTMFDSNMFEPASIPIMTEERPIGRSSLDQSLPSEIDSPQSGPLGKNLKKFLNELVTDEFDETTDPKSVADFMAVDENPFGGRPSPEAGPEEVGPALPSGDTAMEYPNSATPQPISSIVFDEHFESKRRALENRLNLLISTGEAVLGNAAVTFDLTLDVTKEPDHMVARRKILKRQKPKNKKMAHSHMDMAVPVKTQKVLILIAVVALNLILPVFNFWRANQASYDDVRVIPDITPENINREDRGAAQHESIQNVDNYSLYEISYNNRKVADGVDLSGDGHVDQFFLAPQ
jgi:hypothetical protein